MWVLPISSEAAGVYHRGFLLGPRVNAGGRVGQADLGTRLLSCDDAREANVMAAELDRYNRERQEIEAAVLAEAMAEFEHVSDDVPLALVARAGRSEERRVGKECVSTCRSRLSTSH